MAKAKKETEIEWIEREVLVKDLTPYERNPRKISKADFDQLVVDLQKNGYHQRILATDDLRVIGGHQRIKALKKLKKTKIKVLTPNCQLTEAQFRELLIKDNLHAGEYDLETLFEDFSRDELTDYGVSEDILKQFEEEPDFDPAGEDEQGTLGTISPKIVVCPHCTKEFDAREHEKK